MLQWYFLVTCSDFQTDPNLKALNNGLAPPLAENETVDKVQVGKADQGDDSGETICFAYLINLIWLP